MSEKVSSGQNILGRFDRSYVDETNEILDGLKKALPRKAIVRTFIYRMVHKLAPKRMINPILNRVDWPLMRRESVEKSSDVKSKRLL